MAALKIKLVKSVSGHTKKHRDTVTGLGLGRVGSERVVPDTKATRGMVAAVGYLLEVSETKEEFKPFGRRALEKKAAKAS